MTATTTTTTTTTTTNTTTNNTNAATPRLQLRYVLFYEITDNSTAELDMTTIS